MAEGVVDTSVDQNAGGTPDNGGGNKDAGTPQNTPQNPNLNATPGAAGKTRDYDKEIAGFRADLQRERQARQKYERDLAAAKAEVESERRRVAALAGVNTPSPHEQEEAQIRSRFEQLYPWAKDLTAEDVKAIREFKNRASEFDETTRHHWTTHTTKMVTQVQDAIEKELGGKLTDRQRERIARAYAVEGENNQEFLERHANGDPTLIEEFAKQWIEDWFEPARRRVTQTETQRFRPVPTGKDRGIVTHGEKKIDVNDSKQVEDLLVKGFRERNGEFGRR